MRVCHLTYLLHLFCHWAKLGLQRSSVEMSSLYDSESEWPSCWVRQRILQTTADFAIQISTASHVNMFLYCLLCGREKGEGCFVHLCENIFMEGTVLLSPAVLHRTVLLQGMFKGHTVQATRPCISSLFCRISAATGLFFLFYGCCVLCVVFF